MPRKHFAELTAILFVVASMQANASEPAFERLVTEETVNAPVAQVWKAFTTKTGVEAWMVAHAEIDLRVGGAMRTHYDPNGTLGDPKTIVNTILSYDPERMLSLKVAKIPEGFPFPNAVGGLWSVIYFEPLSTTQTKITVVGLGYTKDTESQQMKQFFHTGNAYTLQKLKEYLEKQKSPKPGK